MHAIVHDTYGPPHLLRFQSLGDPAADDRTVLVRVRAAGVNRGDVLAVEGIPYATRLTTGFARPRLPVPGADVAGVVDTVGSAVSDLAPGDEVFGWASGAFAESAVTAPGRLVRKPPNLTFEQAAAVPTAAVTALQALERGGGLTAGTRVLVLGASGGVGSFAVQLAKALGAEVTGLASSRNLQLVRSLGADHVIDYTRQDLASHAGCFDRVIDLVGSTRLVHARRLLRTGGTFVVVGGQNPRSLTGASRFAAASLLDLNPWVPQRMRPLFATRDQSTLKRIATLIADGQVLPLLDATYDLKDAPDALRHVAGGHARGRVVLTT